MDLFVKGTSPPERPTMVDGYEYYDRAGVLLAEKIRFQPKAFRWRRPDAAAQSGYRWGLEGVTLPALYRWPELASARLVILCEGEKAVDRLRSLGFVATCGPAGASAWKGTADLLTAVAGDAVIAVLPDNDRTGERHAQRVLGDLAAHPQSTGVVLKLVALPGLRSGEDVYDWTESHAAEELRAEVDATPAWSPGAAARMRDEARRAKGRDRVSRHRAKHRMALGNGNALDPNALAERNAVTLKNNRLRVAKHRAKVRAALALAAAVPRCNALDVTRNAVTLGERSSLTLQESLSHLCPTDIRSVTGKSVTGERDVETGNAAEEQQAAIRENRCCGRDGAELRCKLCRWSPTYLPILQRLRTTGRTAFDASDRAHLSTATSDPQNGGGAGVGEAGPHCHETDRCLDGAIDGSDILEPVRRLPDAELAVAALRRLGPIDPFIARDPYRPIDAEAVPVDYYEPR
ncbi:MAG: hypothetical protein M3541_00275 [Acidobacteriota bacterium]|nr:hypothetical protein [Acidobacteriota bacterium]